MDGIDILVARRRLDLRQWELASAIGIHPARLSEIERGRRPLTPALEQKIRLALEQINRAKGKEIIWTIEQH